MLSKDWPVSFYFTCFFEAAHLTLTLKADSPVAFILKMVE